MIEALFPISEYWSWGTFALYFIIAVTVVTICKSGCNAQKIGMSKSDVNFRYFFAFLILVLLATLRSEEVGTDTDHYISYFQYATSFNFDWSRLFTFKQMEPGFQYYLYLLRKITDNYTFYFFVTYSIIAYGYIAFIKYFTKDVSNLTFLQLFIFFYVSNMSGARSALGTFFILFSFIALDKKKYFKAILLTFCACTFHYTMIFNFIIIAGYWIFSKKFFNSNRSIWIVMVCVMAVLSSSASFFIKGIFSDTKYDFYSSVSTEELSLLGSIFYLFYFVLCIIYYQKLLKDKPTLLIITMLLMVAYPFLFITGAFRIPNYYALPRLVIWCQMSDYIEENEKSPQGKQIVRIAIQAVVLLYMLFRFTRAAEDSGFQYILLDKFRLW